MSEELSRRDFVKGSLSTGFALAVQPIVQGTIITTDTTGLVAGEVKYKTPDGVMLPAYRAYPAKASAKKRAPVVLVVQEIFGVHEHIKDVCRRFAKRGYYAIAPELYARQGDPSSYTEFGKIISEVVSKVPDNQVMSDLDAAVSYARASGLANTGKLGITGFCWGGRIVWLYAAHNPALKAGAAWYGRLAGESTALTPKHPLDVAAQLKAPVLGLYGGQDRGIPLEAVEKMRASLKAAGATNKAAKRSSIIVYPNAEHGFHADYRPSYNEGDARDAFGKLLVFFKANGAA